MKQNWLVPILITLFSLIFFNQFPKWIIAEFGEGSPWTSYLYQYGLGLVIFCIGLRVVLKSGACKLGRGRDSFWFGVLVGGYIAFATLHASWIYAALNIPYLGGANG